MSDNMSNAEQSAEVASASQLYSSRASPDSANPIDGAEKTRQCNTWTPLEVFNYSLDDWPYSNNRPVNEQSTTNECNQQVSAGATPE